jgi:hypothetical protein
MGHLLAVGRIWAIPYREHVMVVEPRIILHDIVQAGSAEIVISGAIFPEIVHIAIYVMLMAIHQAIAHMM